MGLPYTDAFFKKYDGWVGEGGDTSWSKVSLSIFLQNN